MDKSRQVFFIPEDKQQHIVGTISSFSLCLSTTKSTSLRTIPLDQVLGFIPQTLIHVKVGRINLFLGHKELKCALCK